MLGGGEYSFLDIISNLPDDWKVSAIVPSKGDLAESIRKKNIETKIIPLPPIRPWFVLHMVLSLILFYNTFRKNFPLFIYTNGPRATFYGGIVGKLLGIPVIWHCRIANPDKYLDFFLTRISRIIIVNSIATAKRFKDNVQYKIRLVYNGIDLNWLRKDPERKINFVKGDWKIILMAARVSRWKRHDLALSAFEILAATDPRIHIIFLGGQDLLEPEWWDHLQRKSDNSRFYDRIHWEGYAEDVRPWYKIASVLLLPSENEPFGRVLVEAMACGIPVVAARDGGVPEIVRHEKDGLLVSPGDADEIAVAVHKILSDDNLMRSFSKSARRRADIFDLESLIENIIRVFDETLTDEK